MIPSKLQQFKSILLEGDVRRGRDPVLDLVTGPGVGGGRGVVVGGGAAAVVVGGGATAVVVGGGTTAVVVGGGATAVVVGGGGGTAANVNMINEKKLNIRHLLKIQEHKAIFPETFNQF
ncbi:hypothetical protein CEXT_498061 [Caerostris extrusa]|uniref:Uncharacterized protein n=1 Tax=Caerostris extrusa TaxID=172846 RepID=A0AAV4M3K3_CAEEX|nr:hypothetical protein CEXT_498061 [Caerostris extrusa]